MALTPPRQNNQNICN